MNITLFLLKVKRREITPLIKEKVITCKKKPAPIRIAHALMIQIILLDGFDVCISIVRLKRYAIKYVFD